MLTAIIRTGTQIMMVWLILISFQNAVSTADATEHQTQMKYNNERRGSRTILLYFFTDISLQSRLINSDAKGVPSSSLKWPSQEDDSSVLTLVM
jgi:hypothetical protein